VQIAFDDLEKYLHSDTRKHLPDLIKAALVHYQFEVIHPFHDGNGRIGRLLIPLLLCAGGLLPQPLLFMSPYLERHREDYVRLLFEISRRGAWEDWIEFFLRGVSEQCSDFITRSKVLLDLQVTYRERLQRARASALLTRLVDIIFERPVISIPQAATLTSTTYNSAKSNIEKLVEAKILEDLRTEQMPKLFVAQEVFGIIYRPLSELGRGQDQQQVADPALETAPVAAG
jgi:Fic family protein